MSEQPIMMRALPCALQADVFVGEVSYNYYNIL